MSPAAVILVGLGGVIIGVATTWWWGVRPAKQALVTLDRSRGDIDDQMLTLLALTYVDADGERRRSLLLGRITHAFGPETTNLVLARVPLLPH
ncbi:hypothetical protein ACWEOZ_16630 [Actinoplanes sp. NPDC004185]